jgi:hypothetical protein
MEDLPAPGTPRPRTHGARRRPPTPLPPATGSKRQREATFPGLAVALPTPQRPLTALQASKASAASSKDREKHPSEAHRLLRERLHASGLKRSVVQAQLFPDVRSSRTEGLLPRKRHEALSTSSNQSSEESNLKHKPLVPSLDLNRMGRGLIPSRPTSSAAAAASTTRRRLLTSAGANTARDNSMERKMEREPMSARDRYYVEQRATTAPGETRHKHRLRPPLVSRGYVGKEEVEKVEGPRVLDNGDCNQVDVDESVGDDTPRRGDLLARRNEVTTLTEKLMDGLRRGADTTGVNGDPVHAYGLSTPGGAVPRDSFFYLRRVDSNPYNLEVTKHSRINPKDYYTVSRLGVTHFAPDGVEFQPLPKFERENYIYSLLVKVSCFQHRIATAYHFSYAFLCYSCRSSKSIASGRDLRFGSKLSVPESERMLSSRSTTASSYCSRTCMKHYSSYAALVLISRTRDYLILTTRWDPQKLRGGLQMLALRCNNSNRKPIRCRSSHCA